MLAPAVCLLAIALALGAAPAAAQSTAEVGPDGRLRFEVRERPLLREASGMRLAFRSAGVWRSATELLERRGDLVTLRTGDPDGRRLAVAIVRGSMRASVLGDGPPVEAVRVGFMSRRGERQIGFGERSNAVNQRGGSVEAFVQEGPFLPGEYAIVGPSIPDWALFGRRDASYFPMPWLLSTAGYGALVLNDERSVFELGRRVWSVEVEAPELRLRVFAGRPAALVRALTRVTGRQPAPAAPWLFGPWFQTGHGNESPGELGYLRRLRAADAPVSVAETQMRYMPCGADRGREGAERRRTAALHRLGVAALTYTREAVCRDYAEAFSRGVFLRRSDGSPYAFDAFVGGAVEPLAMIDFGHPDGDAFHASLLARAVANGYDGWMEDYGEYAPPDARSANGTSGSGLHNRYPVLYHRSGMRFARTSRRPLVRFIRSGWTGVHRYAQVVWGGDPATRWGFDGLRSSLTQALTMGLSGISLWGSDIGGFFTLSGERLDPELLIRWIQLGAVSGVMRTKAEGIGVSAAERPQIWERPVLRHWRRWAKLRTQLYPYLVAADAEYRRAGMPIMRHLALAFPRDRRAVATDDSFMFGGDLLAAPVLAPGRRARRLYVPRGTWVDLWRSARHRSSAGLRLERARLLRGGRSVTLPAPLSELPLLARAGTLLPLLTADVDTLAAYGSRSRSIVGLNERRHRLELVAFPRGRSRAVAGGFGRLRSREGARGWQLRARMHQRTRIRLQASLETLRRPFAPAAVALGARRLPRSRWSWNARTGVLTARFDARRTVLRVLR